MGVDVPLDRYHKLIPLPPFWEGWADCRHLFLSQQRVELCWPQFSPNIRLSVFKGQGKGCFIVDLFSIQDKVSVLPIRQNIVDRHDAVRSWGTAGRKGIQFNLQCSNWSRHPIKVKPLLSNRHNQVQKVWVEMKMKKCKLWPVPDKKSKIWDDLLWTIVA